VSSLETVLEQREALENSLASSIVKSLGRDIAEKGSASLLVSGGKTPSGLFKVLSETALDWSKVTISLVDERLVSDDNPDQNGNMVKSNLLINQAKNADFIPLVYDSKNRERNLLLSKVAVAKIPKPFTVVVLGMGSDGHTASLFPDSPELEEGMDLKNENDLVNSTTLMAPYSRITFTRRALLSSKKLILHCYGESKKQVLLKAKTEKDSIKYPISGFFDQKEVQMEVYWKK
jgi:6-phosphogluconolactonase|tara:strand:- start:1654 stop:2352 length:699 start_codon:yes stop_codon:yes gene_type:complete